MYRNIGYILLVGGFLGAAFVSSLDAVEMDWIYYLLGLIPGARLRVCSNLAHGVRVEVHTPNAPSETHLVRNALAQEVFVVPHGD